MYLCRRIGADTRSGSLRLIGNQVQILDSPAAVSFTMHRDILKATETRASWEGSRRWKQVRRPAIRYNYFNSLRGMSIGWSGQL